MNNKKELQKLIKKIVTETINVMSEEHERGEWWIDESGNTTYCDNQVSDQGHESVVIHSLIGQILSHFNIYEDEPDELNNYEDTIKQILIDDGRLTDEEIDEWDGMHNGAGPAEILIKKLLEDKVYNDIKQATDAVFIAYGSSSKDARNYAMVYWNWKIMKTYGGYIEIQTWHLRPEDLGIIVRGIWEIMGENDPDDTDDSDNEVGEDGFPGPRINVTVQASGKRFHDIPLAVLEKKMPQNLHNYQSGAHVGYTENINEDYHHSHKEYNLYEGNKHIVAVFEDNSRLQFEVHFRDKRGIDKEKWRRRAFSKWKTLANEIYRESQQLTEAGNPINKPWKECFREALKHPELQEFIRSKPHQQIFDPINFTPRG